MLSIVHHVTRLMVLVRARWLGMASLSLSISPQRSTEMRDGGGACECVGRGGQEPRVEGKLDK